MKKTFIPVCFKNKQLLGFTVDGQLAQYNKSKHKINICNRPAIISRTTGLTVKTTLFLGIGLKFIISNLVDLDDDFDRDIITPLDYDEATQKVKCFEITGKFIELNLTDFINKIYDCKVNELCYYIYSDNSAILIGTHKIPVRLNMMGGLQGLISKEHQEIWLRGTFNPTSLVETPVKPEKTLETGDKEPVNPETQEETGDKEPINPTNSSENPETQEETGDKEPINPETQEETGDKEPLNPETQEETGDKEPVNPETQEETDEKEPLNPETQEETDEKEPLNPETQEETGDNETLKPIIKLETSENITIKPIKQAETSNKSTDTIQNLETNEIEPLEPPTENSNTLVENECDTVENFETSSNENDDVGDVENETDVKETDSVGNFDYSDLEALEKFDENSAEKFEYLRNFKTLNFSEKILDDRFNVLDFYKLQIMNAGIGDIMTLPKDLLHAIHWEIHNIIDSNLSGTKTTSLVSLSLFKYDTIEATETSENGAYIHNEFVVYGILVRIDDSDTVKLQIMGKSGDPESIPFDDVTTDYFKWKQSRRFIG